MCSQLKLLMPTRFITIPLLMDTQGQFKSATQSTFIGNQVSGKPETTPLMIPVNFFRALNLLGVPTTPDCNNGYAAGAAFSPTDIDPANQTRSDARRTYHDPVINRPNFHVLTGHQVTRLLVADLSGANLPTCPSFGSSRSIGNGTNRGLNVGPADSNRLARKDATSTSVRIMGVEVRFIPKIAFADVLVRFGCLLATTDSTCNS